MENYKFNYRQYVAFINREKELEELRIFIDKEPSEILFIHGPKSSGKTTLLYKLFEQLEKEQKLNVKFLNLRETWNDDYRDFVRTFFGVDYTLATERKIAKRNGKYRLVNFYNLPEEVIEGMQGGEMDPFEILYRELFKLNEKGIRPVIIVDEIQSIGHISMPNRKDCLVISELMDFFITATSKRHLAHVIISSSNMDYLNLLEGSRFKDFSKFFKVDYLCKEDVMEWLLNLEKYSRIKDYTLTEEDAEKVWDVVGGSMWEIQDILSDLFDTPIDEVLSIYKKKLRGIIAHYCQFDTHKKKVLQVINEKGTANDSDFEKLPIKASELKEILRDMVRNNILYFDPTEAIYYPQGKSYQWGIRLYFESLS